MWKAWALAAAVCGSPAEAGVLLLDREVPPVLEQAVFALG